MPHVASSPAEHVRTRSRWNIEQWSFNAFDYGHAILYETLLTEPNAPTSRLEAREYDFITQRLLVKPPRLPLEESVIESEHADHHAHDGGRRP